MFYPKKSLGQNFLVNKGVLDRIVEAAQLSAEDTVIEVGPGTGALTGRLVATGAQVIAIEKDRRLIEPLREKFAGITNLEIIEGDILEFDPSTYKLQADSYKLVANIPYYLTSHLIRLMLEQWPSPSMAVLMVQEEVARRMMAAPPDMNLLALSVQLYAKPSKVIRVSRGSFRPVPDVDSAVVKLEVWDLNNELRASNEKVLRIAKKAFGQKRKQLKATIPVNALEQAAISPTTRPQELSVSDWVRLASALQ
ncbi:MAG: 16S rRNA (adenine(1518)-N(6)/adenine(1519)-N(6))-dimethyltransferase RsmA [Patescibacteria group bacterium]